MKIARIFAHRVELPLVEGSYKWSGGKSVSVFDSTIVGVEHRHRLPAGPLVCAFDQRQLNSVSKDACDLHGRRFYLAYDGLWLSAIRVEDE